MRCEIMIVLVGFENTMNIECFIYLRDFRFNDLLKDFFESEMVSVKDKKP